MNLDERLRTAITAEADRIEPDETTSLGTIRARGRAARRRRRAVSGSILVVAIAVALVASPRLRDDRADVETIDRSRTSTTTTTAPEPSSTTSTTATESSSSTQPPDTPAAPERTTSSTAPEPTAPPATSQPSSDVQFVCPEGGMDEVVALQEAVDQGHQPWWLSPEDVARVCVQGSDPVEPAGPSSYVVTVESTGERVLVELAQPLGPDRIWVVTSVRPV